MNIDVQLDFEGGYLKPLVSKHVHIGYVDGLNNPLVNRYLDTVKQSTQTVESVISFVEYNLGAKDALLFGIWQKGASNHCGTIRLHAIEHAHHTANIGVCIFDTVAWGKGLGANAVQAASQWALSHFNLRWIEAGAYEQNLASQKTFISAGYSWVYDIPGKYLLENNPAVVKVYALKS